MNSCGKNSKEKLRKSRFLRNKRSFIFITILCMGVGFAYLTSNLTITGNTSVSGNSWNIYFTNVQIPEDSVEASVIPTTSGTNTTSIDYTVTLDKPGDFYEFTVDAVNNGTIDAMIQSINMTSLDSDVAKYITYTAMYGNVYEAQKRKISSAKYGSTFVYENGKYTLIDTNNTNDSTHHYTCFNTTGTCSSLAYFYTYSSPDIYYINLSNGKSVKDAWNEMQINDASSTVKNVVDDWFNNTFKTYFAVNSKDYKIKQ